MTKARVVSLTSLAVLAVTLSAVAPRLIDGGGEPCATPLPATRPATAPVPPTTPPPRVSRTRLAQGGTLDGALGDLGLTAEERSRVLRAASTRVDLRRVPAGSGISVVRAADGRLLGVGLRAEPERFLRLAVDEHGRVTPSTVELPVLRESSSATGVVDSSVAQALGGSPHAARLTADFADIFQWDIDLLVEPRRGDVVRVLYETLRLGEVPADLPEFRNEASRAGDLLGPGRILAASYAGEQARAVALWVMDDAGSGDYFDVSGRPLRKSFLKSPLNYRRISSGFSRARRNPVTRQVIPHHGVDFAAPTGTPVVATARGVVVAAGWQGALGRAVKLRHGSEYVTVYGHLSRLASGVHVGARVEQNEVIGYVGSTGRATGPHLHYSMLVRGLAVNPLTFENPPAEPLAPERFAALAAARERFLPLLDESAALAALGHGAEDGATTDTALRGGS